MQLMQDMQNLVTYLAKQKLVAQTLLRSILDIAHFMLLCLKTMPLGNGSDPKQDNTSSTSTSEGKLVAIITNKCITRTSTHYQVIDLMHVHMHHSV